MSVKIVIGTKRDSTIQTILAEALKSFSDDTASIIVQEYTGQDVKGADGSNMPPRQFQISTAAVKSFKTHNASKKADRPLPNTNDGYAEICALEKNWGIPNLHIDMTESGEFKWPECQIRSTSEIKNKLMELSKKGFAAKKRMERLGIKCKDISVVPELAGQIKILKEILDCPRENALKFSLGKLYSLIAKREREVLLYARRQNVKYRKSYDEVLLAQIEIMTWVFNDIYPFADFKNYSNASFKVTNELRN